MIKTDNSDNDLIAELAATEAWMRARFPDSDSVVVPGEVETALVWDPDPRKGLMVDTGRGCLLSILVVSASIRLNAAGPVHKLVAKLSDTKTARQKLIETRVAVAKGLETMRETYDELSSDELQDSEEMR